MKIAAFVVLCGISFIAFIVWYSTTPAAKAIEAKRAAQIEEDRLPRKTSEGNGCEVWAFKPSDRWLYFARCGDRTETVNAWRTCRQVQNGKTTTTQCTEHSMPITQEPK